MGKSTTKRVGSHYVLDDVLGRGSMGTVWRGHDLNDGSPCAIKILNPTLTTDKGATSLGIEVCQALAAIHRVGIRHLDIKPANILIEDPENVSGARITDFGVSEVVAFHGPREVVGTPYYQAPEVAAGWTPTAASDLYSFGVTLYEILAGHMPFQANSAGNLLRNQPPPAIPGVDPRLWNTILTCLAPDPSQRPDSAEVLASELRSWRNGEQPVRLVSPRSRPVRPTPQPMPRPQPVRSAPSATSVATQQRGSGWVIALLAVLVLVGAGVFFYVKGMPGSHSDAAPQPTQAPISTSTPEVRPTRTVTAHATVTTMSSPIQIQLPGGAVECGQGAWIANPRTTCPLALEVVRSVPANHPASFAIDAQDPRTGKSRHFSCNTVGQYVDCGSQDLEVYLVIPG